MSAISRATRNAKGQERDFIKLFAELARHQNRHSTFRDLIDLFAMSINLPLTADPALQVEHAKLMSRYGKDDHDKAGKLFDIFIDLLEERPRDVMGSLYMGLELGNAHAGQFFTPDHISDLMVRLSIDNLDERLAAKPWVTVDEPACGSGGMLLAVINQFIEKGYNPAHHLYIRATDIDATAARMCYVQLSLWGVGAEVREGDTLRMDMRRSWFTPIHYMNGWPQKLSLHNAIEAARAVISESPAPAPQDDMQPR